MKINMKPSLGKIKKLGSPFHVNQKLHMSMREKTIECIECDGTGKITIKQADDVEITKDCDVCKGTGQVKARTQETKE